MKNIFIQIFILLLFSSTCFSSWSGEEIVVVVHKDSSINELTKSQVIDLYMGRVSSVSGSEPMQTIDVEDSDLKVDFYKKMTGLTPSRLKSYRSRLKFTGRKLNIIEKGSEEEAIELVSNSKGVLSYAYAFSLNSHVKVVYKVP